ncbi:hypothetical protein PISMIDRAFT_677356, partial [Pisolithus microcarpus 441]
MLVARSVSGLRKSSGTNDIRSIYHASPCRSSRRRVSPIPGTLLQWAAAVHKNVKSRAPL